MVSLLSRLVVIQLSVQNVRSGFIVIALMCLGRRVYYHVLMFWSVEHALVIIVQ